MVDVHIHSALSADCEVPAEQMIKAAAQRGLSHICFTEHLDVYMPEKTGPFLIDWDAYEAARARLKDSCPGLFIGFGAEAGLLPHTLEPTRKQLDSRNFDFILGSVHVADGYDTFEMEYFEGKTMRRAHACYLLAVLETLLQYDDFDVIAHLDYIAKSAPDKDFLFRHSDYADILDTILEYAAKNDKGIEVNTSVYRRINDPEHFSDVLKRFKELGGRIVTIGSDAHKPENVGNGFERASELVKSAGFKECAVFKNRVPQFIGL